MSGNRWYRIAGAVTLGLVILVSPWPASAQGESVGMITEIKVGKGRVEVKPASGGDWRAAGPFLTLRGGDTVRATENATAVILLSGGRGTMKVDAGRSPVVLAAPSAGAGKLEKARTLVENSVGFLAAGPKEPPKASLSVRAGTKPPVILSPRNGPVLPGPVAFEWLGGKFSRYTVKVVGPSGVVLERNVMGARFEYPAEAPALGPGTRYTVQVLSGNHPPQESQFEVMDDGRAQAVRQALKELVEALGPGVSPSTLAAVQAGVLAGEGLIHDARLTVLAALAKDADEPALHMLLGNLYMKAGLADQAASSFDEAEFLLTKAN